MYINQSFKLLNLKICPKFSKIGCKISLKLGANWLEKVKVVFINASLEFQIKTLQTHYTLVYHTR